MKTLYIFLTRSGTLLSNLVYHLTGAQYTHVSLAFDEDLSTLYSSTRKNGYTMFPAGPSREYLNRGVFLQRENIPCALYALEVSEEAYARARRRAEHMMNHGHLYRFNSLGLLLCWLHIRWQRRRHYFCSQFVSEVLEKSGAVDLPKDSTLMHPSDYTTLPGLECLYDRPAAGAAPAPADGAGRGGERGGRVHRAGPRHGKKPGALGAALALRLDFSGVFGRSCAENRCGQKQF